MKITLSAIEARVIGCLIEKSLTTPDQYPLSLNALTNTCNQKSNRDPVMSLSEQEVQSALDDLNDRHLVMTQSGHLSRVAKYKHRFCNTEFSDLQLNPQELGVICVLLLRGAQTPGELRTRTNRLCEFNNVGETEATLNKLASQEPALVNKLEREPGRRESRYIHCFTDADELGVNVEAVEDVENSSTSSESMASSNSNNNDSRISELEEKVELMQLEIEELREQIAKLKS